MESGKQKKEEPVSYADSNKLEIAVIGKEDFCLRIQAVGDQQSV